MTFADALAKHAQGGKAMGEAVALAAKEAGLTREPTLADVLAAVAQHPNSFPLNYPRVSLR